MTSAEIIFIRETLDLSQRALAKALGVAPYTVTRWEGGREPTGLSVAVLGGIHRAALEAQGDELRLQIIRGKVSMGIGALLFYGLTGGKL